jgi:hypothetical protein
MIALHTLVATLTSFNARRLFEFSVSLLNVPAHSNAFCAEAYQLSIRTVRNAKRLCLMA